MEYINVNELQELQNNPRKISEKDLEILKNSIKEDPEFFEARPIICNEINGKKIVIAGNQRLKASKELGLTKVPCFVFKNLSKDRQDKITIKDNVNNGFWDLQILEKDFKDFDFSNVGLDIKFDIKDIDVKAIPQNNITTNDFSVGSYVPNEQSNNDNTIKQEQQHYPINNEEKDDNETEEKYIICPHCGNKIVTNE